jgi:hypothetical protein
VLASDAALLLAVQVQEVAEIFFEVVDRIDGELNPEVCGVRVVIGICRAVSRHRASSRNSASLSNSQGSGILSGPGCLAGFIGNKGEGWIAENQKH